MPGEAHRELLRAILSLPRRREFGSGRNPPAEPDALIPRHLRGYPSSSLPPERQQYAVHHDDEESST